MKWALQYFKFQAYYRNIARPRNVRRRSERGKKTKNGTQNACRLFMINPRDFKVFS